VLGKSTVVVETKGERLSTVREAFNEELSSPCVVASVVWCRDGVSRLVYGGRDYATRRELGGCGIWSRVGTQGERVPRRPDAPHGAAVRRRPVVGTRTANVCYLPAMGVGDHIFPVGDVRVAQWWDRRPQSAARGVSGCNTAGCDTGWVVGSDVSPKSAVRHLF